MRGIIAIIPFMKLIFLYGPPASGKLTIAEKLSETTNIPLFHNHLSRNLVKDIYKDKVRDHYELIDKIRYDVLEHCSRQGTDLIFTYVYEGEEEDDTDIRKFIDIIETNNGEIKFVELTANREDLIARVSNDSRQKLQKLVDPTKIARVTEDMNKFSIQFVDSLKLNTSELTPEASVAIIANEFELL